ncbi:hypothetical protein [Halomarina oriensis]|uniref:Uncharacterized protein n=1 Tax=Halomarina oriensis TaxID=671145 RepID=A0A6B0GGZ7_9EURY|nr:hypothetical protein [Halomarina oriensis]MWG33840.1 hypothetical protein [Halomarina oriensis]
MLPDDKPDREAEATDLETTKRAFMKLLGAASAGAGLSGASAATGDGVIAALDAADSGTVRNVYAQPTRDQLPDLSAEQTPAVGITDQGVYGYDSSADRWEQFTDEPIQNLRDTDAALGRVDRPLQTTGPRTIHVAPDGSDDAAGTEADPLATVQEAFNRTPVFIHHDWTIDLADGEYLTGKDDFATRTGLHLVWSKDNFTLLGNPDNPENVTINALNAKFAGGKHNNCKFRGFSVRYLTQFAGRAWVRDCRFLGKSYRESGVSALSGKNGSVDIGRSQIGNREDPPEYAITHSLYDNYLLKACEVYAKNYVVNNSYSKQARVQIAGNTTWESSYGLGDPGSATLMVYDETIYVGGFTTVADDFNDDLLTGRITMNGGGHGGYRPEWSSSESAHARGGELVLPAGDDASAAVPSPVGIGTWAFDVAVGSETGRGPPDHANPDGQKGKGKKGNPTTGSAQVYFQYTAEGADYYRLRVDHDGTLALQKSEAGAPPTTVASGAIPDGRMAGRVVIGRTAEGKTTVSVDGEEVLSGTDTFQPMASDEQAVKFENGFDATVRVDNLRVEQG